MDLASAITPETEPCYEEIKRAQEEEEKKKEEEEKNEEEKKKRRAEMNKKRRGSHGGEKWNQKIKDYKNLHENLRKMGFISAHTWEYTGTPTWRKIRGFYLPFVQWKDSEADYDSLLEEHKTQLLATHPMYKALPRRVAETRIMNDYARSLHAFRALARSADSTIVCEQVPIEAVVKEPTEEEEEEEELEASVSSDDLYVPE